MTTEVIRCADCAGFDLEWMRKCEKHGLQYCRGCSCPECAEDSWDDDYDSGEDTDVEDRA